MQINVEYLVLTAKNSTFCSTIEAFNLLLQVDTRLKLNGDTLAFHDDTEGVGFSCTYKVMEGEVTGKPQRFFQFLFSVDMTDISSEEEMVGFTNLLKAVRGIIAKTPSDKSNPSLEIL